jgi:hypothetical protein
MKYVIATSMVVVAVLAADRALAAIIGTYRGEQVSTALAGNHIFTVADRITARG